MDLSAFGLGIIALEGAPIGPNPYGPSGGDTIIQRVQGIDPFNVCPTFPCTDTIDIEIVALSLTSVSPVDLTPLGGPFIGVFADAYAVINKDNAISGLLQPNVINPSIGQMEITHNIGQGGNFTSCFGETADATGVCNSLGVVGGGVFADGIMVVVGGDPNNPLDILLSIPLPRIVVSAIAGSTWIHEPGSDDDFVVGEILHSGPHPVGVFIPPIPEPSTGLLLAVGITMLAARRRRR